MCRCVIAAESAIAARVCRKERAVRCAIDVGKRNYINHANRLHAHLTFVLTSNASAHLHVLYHHLRMIISIAAQP